jgi:tetraacyldisaccharide 4'-kinase
MEKSMKEKLIRKIEKIMRSGTGNDAFLSFEFFLLVCSKIYSVGIKIRNLLYQLNLIKSNKLPCFVISIGNITVGGTGKTPMTMYVADIIKNFGYKPVIITRGYQGTYKDAQAIVSDGSKLLLSVHEAGDEACMMAENLKIPVVVGKNRYQAGILAIKKFNPDVIILDDAFQHIALKRDLNLLLCDFNRPFGNFELLPRGRLREPHAGIQRSDAVILTRSDKTTDISDQAKNLQLLKAEQIFHTFHSAFVVNYINCQSSYEVSGSVTTGFLFSGIADNEDFRNTCENLSIKVKGFAEFSDHHWYTEKDLIKIYEKYKESRADYLVTTQKDYIKIKDLISDLSPQIRLIIIGVQIKFKAEHKDRFEHLIKTTLNTYLKKISKSI